MWFGIISLFPEMFTPLTYGITGRATESQLVTIQHWNPRDFTRDKHKTVDDHPYGGGPGMLMKAEPLLAAIQAAKEAAPQNAKVVYLSPQGRLFSQKLAEEQFQSAQPLILIAGRYEGIDQRVIDLAIDEEWSIGDYILSGGEIAALAVIDTLTRLVPGALGDEESVTSDSLADGLLKYPQYTRPEQISEMKVPDVLLSGDHAKIAAWRREAALRQTWQKRPDLLEKQALSQIDQKILEKIQSEKN